MKEVQALAEYLGLVIGLDPQALAGMQLSKPLLQSGEELIFHEDAMTSQGWDVQGPPDRRKAYGSWSIEWDDQLPARMHTELPSRQAGIGTVMFAAIGIMSARPLSDLPALRRGGR